MKILLMSIAVALFLVAAEAEGKPDNKGGKPQNAQKEDRDGQLMLEAGIELTVSLISSGDARKLARDVGATGYKPLPKGIRKNLARGKPMPPGIQKTRMPAGMLDRLPGKDGYQWRCAGADLLLVHLGTEIVADVLRDVFE